jgi:UDP-glucose 4-epimerase
MRVLVTGGAGYVGSIVAETLLAEDHAVAVYDDLSEGHRDAVPDGAAFVQGDVLDTERLAAALRGSRIEAVVHMAAVCRVGESIADPAKYYRVNVTGAGSPRWTPCAGPAWNGSCSRPRRRSVASPPGSRSRKTATLPRNPYGETKLALERALRWYEAAGGIRAV